MCWYLGIPPAIVHTRTHTHARARTHTHALQDQWALDMLQHACRQAQQPHTTPKVAEKATVHLAESHIRCLAALHGHTCRRVYTHALKGEQAVKMVWVGGQAASLRRRRAG